MSSKQSSGKVLASLPAAGTARALRALRLRARAAAADAGRPGPRRRGLRAG